MVLSDRDIRKALCVGDLVVDPLDDNKIQPASIDLTLSSDFLIRPRRNPLHPMIPIDPTPIPPIDLNDIEGSMEKESMERIHISDGSLTIKPGEFCLGSTVEKVEIPDFLVSRVEGKSSLGRLGLIVHATAGYVDPGFKGKITLEIYNLNYRPIILYPGKSICQLSFSRLASSAVYPYGHKKIGSRYQDQSTVTGSRYTG